MLAANTDINKSPHWSALSTYKSGLPSTVMNLTTARHTGTLQTLAGVCLGLVVSTVTFLGLFGQKNTSTGYMSSYVACRLKGRIPQRV